MINLPALTDALEAHDRVARIVIAAHKGSTPRETGTAMLVWSQSQSGTIGGGALEYRAVVRAQELLKIGPRSEVRRQPLGPGLGQCCGGSVTLVTEIWDAARYRAKVDTADWAFAGIFARQVEGEAALPDRLRRRLARAVEQSEVVPTQLTDGWLIEQVWRDRQPIYIYGAGHVGRALALVLDPLPQFEVTLVDPRQGQFHDLPDSIVQIWDAAPHEVMAEAPPQAAHFIMTPEHDYDLELCHRVLARPFAFAGLIGSATKWARFRSRLQKLGHAPHEIDRIACPIGDPGMGKHPQAIAIGVAGALLAPAKSMTFLKEVRA